MSTARPARPGSRRPEVGAAPRGQRTPRPSETHRSFLKRTGVGLQTPDVRMTDATSRARSVLSARYAGARVAVLRAMSRPRQILPGRFYQVTRRCTQRQFLLRPDEITNQAFSYCLGEASQRF